MTKPAPNSRLQPTPRLLVVVGETASGKSALAMDIARNFNGEIINADSWQVYKGFDVGTAKPSQSERAEIRHHLIDIVNPRDHFSAAVYKDLANKAIADIAKLGKLPIMVGGTGLYVDGVLFDFSFLAPGKLDQRQELNKLTIPGLLSLLEQKKVDLTGIDLRNKRRLIRLLETGGQRPQKLAHMRPNTLVIGLKIPRAKLRQNVERRAELMFRQGLKKEVAELAQKYGWDNEAMKGIGYREFKSYFEGKISAAEVKRRIIKSTLGLAKRQRTWFKRNPDIKWVESQGQADKLVHNFLSPAG